MGEVIKVSIAVISLLLSGLAFAFSFLSFKKTRTATLYSDIDSRYHDLLKMGIQNPEFVNPALTREFDTRFDGTDLLQYERYAFAAWNIVETIVDRGENKVLTDTWYPVIKEENGLHRRWLNHPKNQEKFKNSFFKFLIENREQFPCPSCQLLGDKDMCPRCRELSRIS